MANMKLVDAEMKKDGEEFILIKKFEQETKLRWNEILNEFMGLESSMKDLENREQKTVKDIMKEIEEDLPKQKEIVKEAIEELKLLKKTIKPFYEEAKKTLKKKGDKSGKNEYFG